MAETTATSPECPPMTAVCASCHAALEPGKLEGLCPRCLLAQALPVERVVETTAHGAFVPPSPADLAPLFPHLEILDLLGQGGMGAVYKARQVKLDRLVALKILPPGAAAEPGFADRFTREARALAKLSHPNIVAVHDFGEAGGVYYLLMEFVEGVNLRQSLSAGRLQPRQALTLVGEVCAALQYAHDMGVVHRDIKPENVLLDRQGHAKIADFGLAKLVGAAQPPARLTGTQQAMGTPHYMAPEQWERPLEVDHRADIYSLGVVFYELLTGELPLGKFAPPSAKAGGDARLDQVVLRAMEKEPAQRYQHMSEMKSAVDSVGQPPSVGSTAPQSGKDFIDLVAELSGVGMPILILAVMYWLLWPTDWWGRLEPTLLAVFISIPLWVALGFTIHYFTKFALSVYYHGEYVVKQQSPESEDQANQVAANLNLSAAEVRLRKALKQAESDSGISSHLEVIPDIEGDRLATWRGFAQVPPDERVLGLLALVGDSEDGDSEDCGVLFGGRGLYWHNGDGTPHPGVGSITYDELSRRPPVNHGNSVYVGDNKYLCPNEENSGVTGEALTALLLQVRAVVSPEPPGKSV